MPKFPFVSLTASRQVVKVISPRIDLKRGLAKPPTLPWLPVAISSEEILPKVKEAAPVNGIDIVEWMQLAASEGAILDGACEEYNRAGSQLLSSSGDPYIPGVKVGNLKGESITGSRVKSQGYGTVITPRGNFNVPDEGKATGIFSDLLAWATCKGRWSIQWLLSLLQWKDLARTPIDDRIRFANLGGLVAPNFVTVSPRIPAPLVMMRIGMTSDKPQTVAIKGRGLTDYTGVLFEDSFPVDSGESETTYNILGFPFTADFLLELQPRDGTQTILDYIETIP